MDMQAALRAYIGAVLPERRDELYRRALKKCEVITRGMKPEDRAEYLRGPAFARQLARVEEGDRALQALLGGELPPGEYMAEYERLRPMILSQLRQGCEIELDFLRSVARCRAPLNKAREALRLLKGRELRRALEDGLDALVDEACRALEDYLGRGDLTHMVRPDPREEKVAAHVLETGFARGVGAGMIERALRPKSLDGALRSALDRAFPALAACGGVEVRPGRTVAEEASAELQRAKRTAVARIRARFPRQRLRRLLADNPSLKKLQKQQDARLAKERRLRSALLDAVPAHYRDLYPLARQLRRRFILHLGPTNSGKTHDGVGRLHGARNGIYLGPLRLLAAEQFEVLNMEDVPCSLVTGEERIQVPGSRVQSSTVEMADLRARYDVAVIDECQMVGDRDRGGAWTAAILGLCADEIHACASPDAEGILRSMILDCGDELSVVRHERMTPLEVEKEGFQFPDSVRAGDALIVFSKARVHAVAAELKRLGHRVSLIYGALPPDVRRDQAERFRQGDSDVVVSTDAIAMGMNLPIERVVFLESEKFDGDITRPLLDSEIKQIAGRAGRYGQYEVGYVNACGFRSVVAQAINKPLPPVTEAVIGFPESLLGLPLTLTQILRQWLAMQDRGCFSKASTARMEALAAMMETRHTDKALLYRFICIPFDETEPELLSRWKAMYHAECAKQHIDVLAQLPPPLNPDDCTVEQLDGLEADYRCCDLYYNYARLFLDEPDAVLEKIQSRKFLISQGIIHILSTQRLRQKTCPGCGKYLPWNWPYRLCENCHERRRGRRGSRPVGIRN